MIKNIVIALVGFATGAVAGVAASSSYFRKNGCTECQAKTEADVEDAYRKGLKEGRESMAKLNNFADDYRSNEINEFFERKNEDFKKSSPFRETPFDTSKNEVFERINKAFDREKAERDPRVSDMLEEDYNIFITITTREEFEADAEDSYDRYMWTYWSKNDVVSNELDDRVDKHEEYVGRAFAKIFKENPNVDTLYIRNDDKEAFYELEKVDDTYIEGPISEMFFEDGIADVEEEDDE